MAANMNIISNLFPFVNSFLCATRGFLYFAQVQFVYFIRFYILIFCFSCDNL